MLAGSGVTSLQVPPVQTSYPLSGFCPRLRPPSPSIFTAVITWVLTLVLRKSVQAWCKVRPPVTGSMAYDQLSTPEEQGSVLGTSDCRYRVRPNCSMSATIISRSIAKSKYQPAFKLLLPSLLVVQLPSAFFSAHSTA